MKNVNVVILLFVSLILASCVIPPNVTTNFIRDRNISSMFDRDKAMKLLEDGSNTVKGSSLLRQRGGGVVTCAGNSVLLIPETPYARERMVALYRNTVKGYTGYNSDYGRVVRRIRFKPDLPEYYRLMKETTCDAQGYFKFNNVADGNFFVTTSILWEVSSITQGGILMYYVRVSGGETKEIVLAH